MALLGFFEHAPVMSPKLQVYVNGVLREHISADWAIDTSGGLPDSLMSSGTGIRSRTGSIHFTPIEVVSSETANPLRRDNGWPPREGDSVKIYTEYAGVQFPRFTGRIDKVSAPFFYDASVEVDITDSLGDYLNALVNIKPQVLPGYGRSSWVVHAAFEQAGLGAVPPPRDGTTLHNGYQSGVAPIVGSSGPTGAPYGESGDPYGVSAWSGNSVLADPNVRRDGRFVCVTGRASTTWDSTVYVTFDNGKAARLVCYAGTRNMGLWTTDGGTIWTGKWQDDTPLPVMAMLISDKDIRIWTGFDKNETLVPTTLFAGANVRSATGNYLVSVDVTYEPLGKFSDQISNLARYPVSWARSNLEQEQVMATRGYEHFRASEVIDQWCEGTLASVWMDEQGKPCAYARDRLVNGPSVRTLYMSDKVLGGGWELGRDGKRKGVAIFGLMCTADGSMTRAPDVTVYQPANIQEIKFGETKEEIISVPDEEDWVQVDTNWDPIIDMGHGIDNRVKFDSSRVGSYWQIGFEDPKVDDRIRWTGSGYEDISASLEALGQRAFKMTHHVAGKGGSDIDRYVLASPNAGVDAVRGSLRGVPMPIIRATAVVKWAEFTVVGATRRAENYLPEYSLESGWWLTLKDAQRYADTLSAELTGDRYTFDSVPVLWDPTRQVGDSETWHFTDGQGQISWTAQVLITGYSEKWDENGVPEQSVDVQVKSLVDPRAGKTYADMSSAYRTYADIPATKYAAVEAALPGKA